jgi:CTP:molybdopterin cytidylyltransferase MocA
MKPVAAIDVIVLAGDRGPDDPLAKAAGVTGKTLVPVSGQPMLTRVLDALAGWPGLNRILLVASCNQAYRSAVDTSSIAADQLVWVEPAGSPSQSVAKALAAADRAHPVMLTTGDHPLLSHQWLDQLLSADPNADLQVGLVDWAAVMQRFPGSRRTRYRFSDRSICGTNLFVFRSEKADAVVRRWRQVEQDRKRPWRIVSLLGWANLARYLAGKLALNAAFVALSTRLNVDIRPVLLDDPLCAVDVDSAADLKLVEQVFLERRQAERGRAC